MSKNTIQKFKIDSLRDKTLLESQITLVQKEAREKGHKKRARCPYDGSIVYSARIEAKRIRNQKEKRVGRPKKDQTVRYMRIGSFCFDCGIFFYVSGTPNYKLHLRVIEIEEELNLIYPESDDQNKRPICPYCEDIVYAVRIEANRKKHDGSNQERYHRIGHFCLTCEVFYYPSGTPNYKIHLKTVHDHADSSISTSSLA